MSEYCEIRDYLFGLKNRGSKFGIERMVRFVEALGHPEAKFPLIHVAGTNGKGSTCAMLEALYRGNGYKTGLFSSPHLVHLGERVQVNRRILDEATIVEHTRGLKKIAEKLGEDDPDLHPTFFEFIAAMAFLNFAKESVDIGLIETGLGGRLDATNVVEPELSIITSISYDHTELLGETLTKIAGEKAGIIKPGKPVLIGCLPEEAEVVMRATAKKRGCKLYSVRDRFSERNLPTTNLAGDFQRWNAAVAVYATEILQERFPIERTDSLHSIYWPGRWQQVTHAGRTLILDATHNPEGADALEQSLKRLVDQEGKPIIIAGTLGDDRGQSLMEAVSPFARELHLVEPNQDRASTAAFLESCLPEDPKFSCFQTNLSAIFPSDTECTIGREGETIVVTGSLYLIGEVLERIQGGSSIGADFQDKF